MEWRVTGTRMTIRTKKTSTPRCCFFSSLFSTQPFCARRRPIDISIHSKKFHFCSSKVFRLMTKMPQPKTAYISHIDAFNSWQWEPLRFSYDLSVANVNPCANQIIDTKNSTQIAELINLIRMKMHKCIIFRVGSVHQEIQRISLCWNNQ